MKSLFENTRDMLKRAEVTNLEVLQTQVSKGEATSYRFKLKIETMDLELIKWYEEFEEREMIAQEMAIEHALSYLLDEPIPQVEATEDVAEVTENVKKVTKKKSVKKKAVKRTVKEPVVVMYDRTNEEHKTHLVNVLNANVPNWSESADMKKLAGKFSHEASKKLALFDGEGELHPTFLESLKSTLGVTEGASLQ